MSADNEPRTAESIDPGLAPIEVSWETDPWDTVEALPEDHFAGYAPGRRPRTRWVWVGLSLVLVVVLLAGAVGLWYLRQVNPPGEPLAAVNFTVLEGDTLDAVSERLEDDSMITSAGVFRWYVERRGGIEFVPGYYQLKPRDHMGNLMAALSTPPAQTFVNVTFPEGYTVEQVAARLEEKVPRIDAETFKTQAESGAVTSGFGPAEPQVPVNMEGLLFPDTYQISGDDSATRVIERMARLMERVGRQEGLESAEDKVGLSPYEVLIVASMIEREAKVAEDRAKIARVIYNRLRRNMELQIDATVRYQQPTDLPFTELVAIDTPYNSYLYKGLPPTPIANPGRAAIAAAMNPAPNPDLADPICRDLKKSEKCEYIYYVIADKEGGHVFAATLEQHEANVAAAREAGLIG
jgi:UPF0755 protein